MNKENIIKQYNVTESEMLDMLLKAESLSFDNHLPNDEVPTAIFTGGQPGAGKSSLVFKTEKEFKEQGKDIIVFDLDLYRNLYTKSSEISKKYPGLFQELTNKYSGKIMEKLSEKAINENYNFIMEGTMGKSVYTIDLLQNSNKKYNIIARLMAVSREESILSIFERYLEMKKKFGYGRFLTISSHDERYYNFPNIANTLENRNIEVEVYSRTDDITNPKLIYKTNPITPNLYDSVNDAIKNGREDSLRKCMKNFEDRLYIINKEILSGETDQNIIMELDKLNKIFGYEYKKEGK